MRCTLDNLIFKDHYLSAPSTIALTVRSGSKHPVFDYWILLTILTTVKLKITLYRKEIFIFIFAI